jgi:hypothetical protein
MAEGLWEYIRQRPTAASTDMRLFLENLYGVTVSKGTMCNFLRKQAVVYQKLLAEAAEKFGKRTETDGDGLRCPFEGCQVRSKCRSSLQDHERNHKGRFARESSITAGVHVYSSRPSATPCSNMQLLSGSDLAVPAGIGLNLRMLLLRIPSLESHDILSKGPLWPRSPRVF